MIKNVNTYLPENALEYVNNLLETDDLIVKVKKQRKTKHGDYKKLSNGKHQITVNENLNKYRFLLTLIHEIAHYKAFIKFGYRIKPHGKEWKYTFQRLMLPLLNTDVFSPDLLPLLAQHFKNPKASSNTDHRLYLALKTFDPPSDKNFIFELPLNTVFRAQNGKTYKLGKKRTKRYECVDMEGGRLWLFSPNAEVDIIKEGTTTSSILID